MSITKILLVSDTWPPVVTQCPATVIFYSKGELKFLYGIILEKREYIGYEETLEIHTKQIIY